MADPQLLKLIGTINKSLKGAAAIMPISEVRSPHLKRRPSGIMSLDVITRGGLPGGALVQVHGPDGVGKDALTNMYMAENQRIHGENSNVFWMSFGYPPDLGFMRFCGVEVEFSDDELRDAGYDPEREVIPDSVRGKSVGNLFFVDLMDTSDTPSEALFEAVLKIVDSGLFQLGIINELGSGETKDGAKKELTDNPKMADWSLLVARFCQRWFTSIKRPLPSGEANHTTVVVINPVRANTDSNTSKFRKHEMTSGYALRHAKVVDLHLKPGKSVRKAGKKIGKEVVVDIAKGKHGMSEGARCTYQWLFSDGVDRFSDLALTAKSLGTIKSRGASWYVLDSEDKISGGINGVIEYLRENPKVADALKKATLEAADELEYADDDYDEE